MRSNTVLKMIKEAGSISEVDLLDTLKKQEDDFFLTGLRMHLHRLSKKRLITRNDEGLYEVSKEIYDEIKAYIDVIKEKPMEDILTELKQLKLISILFERYTSEKIIKRAIRPLEVILNE